MALDLRRGKTSMDRLKVDWTYPVWKPKGGDAPKPGSTVAVEREHALSLAEAYELVTDGDRRPLLVLRECELCKGTDHALLSRTLDNEQTVLLTHWFHCVKLPPNILDAEHPFYNLFARSKDGERIPHLYFCDPDGGNKEALPGDQTQAQLWEVMLDCLDRCYDGDAKKSVRELRLVLSQFDRLDLQENDVKARIDREIEKHGPDSDKITKYEADLQKIAKEREKLLDREKAARALALKDLGKDSRKQLQAAGDR